MNKENFLLDSVQMLVTFWES